MALSIAEVAATADTELVAFRAMAGERTSWAGVDGRATLADVVVAGQRASMAGARTSAGMAGSELVALARTAVGAVELPGVGVEPGVAGR